MKGVQSAINEEDCQRYCDWLNERKKNRMRIIDGAKLVEKLRLIATCWFISPFVSKEKHNGAVDMLREVEREVKEAPTLTPPNEWVSVEERLPEDNFEVLMWRKKWKIAEAGTYRKAHFWVYDKIGDSYTADDITHWMLLPAPPEKEKDR